MFADATKHLACRNYLNIDPNNFDTENPLHIEAGRLAATEIIQRARKMAQEAQTY